VSRCEQEKMEAKLNEFNALYKQFLAGMRWLNRQMARGGNVGRDKEDFIRLVADPLDAMWSTFTDKEKDYFLETHDKTIN